MNTLKLLTSVKRYKNTYICQALARYQSRSYCKGIGRVLFLFLNLVSMFSLSAQTPRKDSGADGLPSTKALNIGDKIPQFFWDTPLEVVNHPSGQKTIKLSEYRDKKIIILDFWATWCSACISAATYHTVFFPIAISRRETIDRISGQHGEKTKIIQLHLVR